MPSKEKFAVSPTDSEFAHQQRTPSQEAVAGQEGNSDAFDDADEEERARNSISFAPSEVETDVQGLGYPSSAIYFGSPPREGGRVPSIRAVPSSNNVLSPPMPQMGNLMQQFDRDRTQGPRAHMHDGKYLAQANQNFNLHPHIHPPPVVSLSSATWSAAPPSTYRAEPDVGAKALPSWLHFDAKELELWGIPSLNDNGEVFAVRIIERMPPREKRRSYDSSQILKDETTEREVARLVIEVVDGLKSPGAFSLEDYGQSPPASAL
jgi:axial budding pattern protein 2